MHEWSLTRAVVQAVVDAATAQGAARVRAVTLAIGPLAATAPELLRAQFAVAAAGTIAEGARLRFTMAPARATGALDGIVIDSVELVA